MCRGHEHFSPMGIINITPDSFSDGKKFTDKKSLLKKLDSFRLNNVTLVDIGAESTAPMNNAITLEEEISRFKTHLFPLLEDNSLNGLDLSIDTYRLETFKYVYSYLRNNSFLGKIFWNDVSGVIDDALIMFMLEKTDFDYVYCHNLTQDRMDTSNHMKHSVQLENELFFENMCHYFSSAENVFKDVGVIDRVIFDPCFGFAKTFEQNWFIINNFSRLYSEFSEVRWLVGISRKSFLKKLTGTMNSENDERFQIELMHTHILTQWMKDLKQIKTVKDSDKVKFYFRIHDELVYDAALRMTEKCLL